MSIRIHLYNRNYYYHYCYCNYFYDTQLLFSKSMQRQDIMGLSLAIRTVRLKYLYKKPMHIRHQIALETLQLWGPLSFQIGYANSIPELEIYSYIQLFTKSFSSFINWYTIFQPIGKKLINNFCLKLENKLSKQKKLSFIFSKILIQSRIKTPSSAFKKMLNNAKMKDELYDILGIRIIATNRNNHHHDHYHNDDNNQQLSFDSQDYDDSSFDNYSDDDIDRRMNSDRIRRRWNGNYNNTSSINTTDTHDRGYNENVEYLGLLNIRSIIHSITEWGENIDRFKDYIKYPKRSGYQSLHMNIHHEYSNANMEIQIRSDRMHEMAEYGPASHRYYKALILPKEVEV